MQKYEDFAWTSPAALKRISLTATPWSFYLETMVWTQAVGLSGVVRPVLEGGSEHPPFGSLHVLSATQPGSEPTGEDNAARLAVLDLELQTAGIGSIPAVGSSFDGKHQECSRAVFGLSNSEACALGRRFGQVAIFAWHGPRWSLLACASDRREDRGWIWVDDAEQQARH